MLEKQKHKNTHDKPCVYRKAQRVRNSKYLDKLIRLKKNPLLDFLERPLTFRTTTKTHYQAQSTQQETRRLGADEAVQTAWAVHSDPGLNAESLWQ